MAICAAAATSPRRSRPANSPESHPSPTDLLFQRPFPSRPSPSPGPRGPASSRSSLLRGPEPDHSRFSCFVRKPDARERRGQLGRSGARADVLMKNLQEIIRGSCPSPSGQNPPRLVAQASVRILESAPLALRKIGLWEANDGV